MKKKLSILITAITLIFGFFVGTLNVFAQEDATNHVINGTEAAPATIKLKKTLITDKGVNLPELNFNFTATKKALDGNQIQNPTTDDTMPAITFTAANFTQANDIKDTNFNDADKVYKITKEQDVTLNGFKHAGKYEWTIAETNAGTTNVIYDTKTYTLTAYVANNAANTALFVKSITVTDNATNKKVENLEFINKYSKATGSLEISKTLVDSVAANNGTNFNNRAKEFTFTINLTKPASASNTLTEVTAKYYKQDGSSENKTINFSQDVQFTLKDGEMLKFEGNLPIGTTYTVKEAASDNYTPSAVVTQNGVVLQFNAENENKGTKNTEFNAANNANTGTAYANKLFVGEGDNKVEFKNTYDFMVVTGVIMKNLPFILMVSIAVAGFVVYVIVKRKRYNH